jgi:hypothetical protein
MINIKEILTAWSIAMKPSPLAKKIAEDRLSVCLKCEFREEVLDKKVWSAICGKCGCPLMAKVFSQEISPCPLSKWDTADSKNGLNVKQKETNSIL